MGKIIPFEKLKDKENVFNSNKKKLKTSTEKETTKCPAVLNLLKEGGSIDVDYAGMGSEQLIEFCQNVENEEEERFRDKYRDILAAVPVNTGAKIQYLANIMLKLIPNIFHGTWDARFDAFADFCEFYISGFDSAYSDYVKENRDLEKEYQYKFRTMKTEKLEEELEDCLTKIIEIFPEKREEDKTEMLYQAARLFELEEILLALFCEELMKE